MTKGASAQGVDALLLRRVQECFAGARPSGAAPLPLAVAVSGGGDSMALLHLLHRAARFDLHAVTVDHGLRAGSGDEAAGVAAFCAGLGIPHQALLWQGPAPSGNLMDQARRARMALIAAWAVERGIGHVALGHTADDQAETFLMNLARSAGLDGLSGMRADWDEAGVRWSRPLISVPRADLRAYLRRAAVDWIDDPTNEDARFARVRARQALAVLAPLGITVAGLNATVAHLGSAQAALREGAHRVADRIDETGGALQFSAAVLRDQPQDIRRRLLVGMIRWMNGRDYPPREASMVALDQALTQGRDATLGGARFQCRGGAVTVLREMRAVQGRVPLGQVWDHRWRVTGADLAGHQVGALGAGGLRQIPDWRDRGIRRGAALVSPAVWDGERLVAAPVLGFGAPWTATFTASFGLFLISH